MTSTHIYFCSQRDCKMEVFNYNDICGDCRDDAMSSEPSECPGCGEDILIGANGYCADCWGERFDSIELSYCMGCGERAPFIENQHCRDCNDRRVEASQAIKTWWMRLRSARYDEYEGISCRCVGFGPLCGHCLDMLDEAPKPHWCGKQECERCQSEYYEQCGGCGTNCNLWDERYCKACYDVRYGKWCTKGCGPTAQGATQCYACIDGERSAAYAQPLPPSPEPDYREPADVRDEIEMITAKLRGTSMTPGQQADWRWLLRNRQEELARMEAEMWEGYDQDDLRKMDQNMRIL